MSAKWNYFKPAYGTSAEGCQAIYLENIDTSLRRIAASLENGEKVKQLDAALGKAEGEIKRLSLELAETKNDLGKVEGRVAHFQRLCEKRGCEFQVGDIIAYLNDEGDGWNCWEVKAVDERFLYDSADKSGDNIAKLCAYMVKSAEVMR